MACPRRKLGVGGWPRHRDGDKDVRGSAMSCRLRLGFAEMDVRLSYVCGHAPAKDDVRRECVAWVKSTKVMFQTLEQLLDG
jgi:hypothetical protein